MSKMKLFSIGDMAKLCGISARQLRYYDQIGVIRPSYRDPSNGYRYYTEDQIELLFFLRELRNLGISNDSIQRLFINRDVEQLVQELQINLSMVEREIHASLARYKSIVNALVVNTKALAYLHGQEAIDSDIYGYYRISIARIPPTKILFIGYENDMDYDDRNDYINRVVELTRLAESMHLKLADTKMFIRSPSQQLPPLGDLPPGKAYYEIAREIVDKDIPEGSPNIKSFGGINALSAVSVGAHAEATDAYPVLQKWAQDHNIAISDTSIEEYMVDTFTSYDERRFVTRIMIPLYDSREKIIGRL